MADALAGLVEKPLGDHLVIGIERAVEEEERRALEPRAKRIVEPGAARDIEEVTPRRGVGDLEACGVAFLRAEIPLRGLVLEMEPDFARTGKRLACDADRTRQAFDGEGPPEFHRDAADET